MLSLQENIGGIFVGGPGSGRWSNHIAKLTVEECSVLDLRLFSLSMGILRPGVHQYGQFLQRYFSEYGDQKTMIVKFELDSRDMTRPFLELCYRSPDTKQEIIYDIELQITEPNYGGTRFYFGCPICAGGITCNRRMEKLYLPPGGGVFGCRTCQQLTYMSSQTSHCRGGMVGKP